MPNPTKRLVLDRQHMIALVSDPEFYTTCPVFLWLRNTAMAAHARYQLSKGCCGSDWSIMRPVIDAFFANLRELHELDPQNVECVRNFISAKKGYTASPCVIYYRRGREGRPDKFTF